MNFEEFEIELNFYLKELNIIVSKDQTKQFYDYMNLLIEWNKVMNLTGIVEPKDIILKHFVDSLTVVDRIKRNNSVIDVGTGAGFPGIPIKILYPDIKITLLDSLNKRINFLNEVINKLDLKEIETVHGRAEDFGNDLEHREKYDIAIARAVAPLNILLEYLMPFVNIGGRCICMKGSNVESELVEGKNAIKVLGGEKKHTKEFFLPNTDIKRTIIEVEKQKNTPKMFPRKAGTPSKTPL